MSDIAARTANVITSTAGNTIAPAVTALLTAAGATFGHPEVAVVAVPVGALAAGLTEEGIALVRATWNDKVGRISRFADTVSDESGSPIEDVIRRATVADPRVRELLARAVETSASSLDEQKVDMLARAFVRGAEDGAVVDEMLWLVELLRKIEVAHVRALRVLFQETETPFWGVPVRDLSKYDAGLAASVYTLAEDLRRNGLAHLRNSAAGVELVMTALGKHVAKRLAELGDRLPQGDTP
jgi:hypothetical protein